jgi:hypothetical protein
VLFAPDFTVFVAARLAALTPTPTALQWRRLRISPLPFASLSTRSVSPSTYCFSLLLLTAFTVTSAFASPCLSALARKPLAASLRKEVIQPHLPVRLPCYDFVPVIRPTLGNSHDVTGGVYKARERIHRSIADLRLLATPASCRRVAACNLNYERL